MTDDRGDAEFEASLAGVPRRGSADATPPVAGDAEALQELRALRVEVAALADRLDDDAGRSRVLSRFDALESKLDGLLAERATIVEQLQDHLADVASGAVVGALFDEVRDLREAVDRGAASGPEGGGGAADVLEALATLRGEVEGIGAAVAATAEPTADPAVAGMRQDVQALVDEVRALSDAVAAVERDVALPDEPAGGGSTSLADDPQLAQLTEELTVLRTELAEGLVVEPSDALTASLDALRAEVDSLHAALGDIRSGVGAAPAEPAGLDPAALEELKDEIRAAGAIGDQVVDALREELKAVRRRIAVKASERVLDDDQLAQIADAVAARLGRE